MSKQSKPASQYADYNTTETGKRLFERMAFLFRGETPDADKSASSNKKSEYSAAVAERYANLDDKISVSIKTLESERKSFRKYANETLSAQYVSLLAYCSPLSPTGDVDANGNDLKCQWENDNFVVVAKQAPALKATVSTMLEILAKTPDTDLLEESAKKGRGNSNGQPKLLADKDPKRNGDGEIIQDGGNEHFEGSAYTNVMIYDRGGQMRGILKLTARCARALDRNEIEDAGEMYAVLTGELPFRKEKDGTPISFITLGPDVADKLLMGRLYERIFEAFKLKGQQLEKLLKDTGTDDKAKAVKVLESKVLSESLERTKSVGAEVPQTEAAIPSTVETPTATAEVA